MRRFEIGVMYIYIYIMYNMFNLRATAHAADPSNSEEEVKEEAMHGWV